MKDKRKLIRYLISGGTSFVVEYSSFLVIVYIFSIEAWVGQAISYSLALVVNFLLIRNWTFGHYKSGNVQKHLVKYGLLVAFNLPVTTLLIYILASVNIPAFLAKLFVVVLVTIWNYIIYEKIIFTKT